MRKDRRTDAKKLTVAFRNFVNDANKSIRDKNMWHIPKHSHKPHSDITKENDDVTIKMGKQSSWPNFVFIPVILQQILSFTTVHSVYHLIRWVFFEYSTCVKSPPLVLSVKNTDHFPFEWVLAKPVGFCVVNLVQSRVNT